MGKIKELANEVEWKDAFPVIKQLRPHLDETTYLELVTEAQEKEDYRMFALYDDSKIVAITGFMPMITFYNGRFIWVCDLVTDENERSKGYGESFFHMSSSGLKKMDIISSHYHRDYSVSMLIVFMREKCNMIKSAMFF